MKIINSAVDALPFLDLSDIIYYRTIAVRLEADLPDEALGSRAEKASDAQNVDLSVQARHDESRLEVRCQLVVDDIYAHYEVDAASRFSFAEPMTFEDDALEELIGKVGVMAVYPYLREALFSLASKLRVEVPLIGLIRGDSVKIEKMPEQSN